ncbi:MAG: O-antigen ligase family protein [Rudaea sp.]
MSIQTVTGAFSYRTGLMLLGAGLAIGFGYAVVYQSGLVYYLVLGAVAVGIGVATLILPIELLLVAAVLGGILADSWLVPRNLIFYSRFAPAALLSVRAALELVVRRRRDWIIPWPFIVPAALFSVLAGFSTLYSVTSSTTLQRTATMASLFVGFGLAVPQSFDSSRRMEQGFRWVAAALALTVLGGIVIFGREQFGTMIEYSFVRLQGVFTNSNTQGLMAMVAFFAVLGWWHTEQSPSVRATLAMALVGLVIGVVTSGSRASMIGLMLGGLLFLWLRGRVSRANAFLVLLVLLLAIMFAFLDPTFGRVLNYSGELDRVALWQRAFEIGSAHPILGVGFGSSDRLFYGDVPYLQSLGIFTAGSHNSYLRLFVDLGVVGLLIGLSIFAAVFMTLMFAPGEIRGDGLAAALAGGVMGGLVDSFFEDWLFGFGSAATPATWLFVVLLALRVGLLARRPGPEPDIPAEGPLQDSFAMEHEAAG